LFAVPDAPNNNFFTDPTADSQAPEYSELSVDVYSNPEIPDPDGVSPNDNLARIPPKAAPANADSPEKREDTATKAAVAKETPAPPSTAVHIEDERSCRGLATDSPL
jgi:hypothetical protein